ncbi:MAG: class II aldolase/adducin family protein [Proteobacteria bacterium]|nr:class II aldolase/adducin family protein [Burkholderiales bacterium]
MGSVDADIGSRIRASVSDAEWALRCELACAHRLVAHFVFVDLTYNHLSVRCPDNPNHFLVKAQDVFMEQVTASNLVKYDLDGNQVAPSPWKAAMSAYNIHGAVLRERPDLDAVLHTHSPGNLAVSAQKAGLQMLTQQAMRFHGQIAYYPYDGDDASREGATRLARAMGDRWLMILHNHGALVAGHNVPEVYIQNHFLELACRAQIGALAGGTDLIVPSEALCAERARLFGRPGLYDAASRDWIAGRALVEKLYPDYCS